MAGTDSFEQGKKNFSTSSRNLADPPPRADADGSRQPAQTNLQGEQNEHLKHKSADEADKGKGNASPEPHLPSHNAKPTGTRGFSTSAMRWATKPPGGYAKAIAPEPASAGYVSASPPSNLDLSVSSYIWPISCLTWLCEGEVDLALKHLLHHPSFVVTIVQSSSR